MDDQLAFKLFLAQKIKDVMVMTVVPQDALQLLYLADVTKNENAAAELSGFIDEHFNGGGDSNGDGITALELNRTLYALVNFTQRFSRLIKGLEKLYQDAVTLPGQLYTYLAYFNTEPIRTAK